MKQVEKQGKFANYLMDRALIISEAGRKRLRDRPMNFILEKTLRPKIRGRFGGRINRVARASGLSRRTIERKMNKYALLRRQFLPAVDKPSE